MAQNAELTTAPEQCRSCPSSSGSPEIVGKPIPTESQEMQRTADGGLNVSRANDRVEKSNRFHSEVNIIDEAIRIWRRARSVLSKEAKSLMQADRLKHLAEIKQFPMWALGFEAFPRHIWSSSKGLAYLRKKYAQRVLTRIAYQLRHKATKQAGNGAAFMEVVEQFYADDTTVFQRATSLLRKYIGRDKQIMNCSLDNEALIIRENQITDQEITKRILRVSTRRGRAQNQRRHHGHGNKPCGKRISMRFPEGRP